MLPKRKRLSRQLIENVIRKGQATSSKHLTLKYLPFSGLSLFSFVVSIRVNKKATTRNLLKRRSRHIIRKHSQKIKDGYAYVIIFKVASVSVPFQELETETISLFKKANLIND